MVRDRFYPWVGKIPWRREMLPTPVFWPREFHGLYSLWGHRVRRNFHFHFDCIIMRSIYKFVVSDLLKSLLNTENNSKTCTMSQINTLLPVNFRSMWRELPKFTLHQSQRNRAWEVRKARAGFRTMNETISETLGMCIKTVLFWGKKKSFYFESDSHFVHFSLFSKDVSV